MSFPLEALGNYIQKPFALSLNILDPALPRPDLHAFYDPLGYCVGLVVLSPKHMTPDGERVIILDLRIEAHVPLKKFLSFLASHLLADVSVLLYQRRKADRIITKQISAGPRTRRWTAPCDDSFSVELDPARVPFHRRAGIKEEQREAREFGMLYMALLAGQVHAASAPELLARIRTWVLLQQYKIFDSPSGASAGVITWAWLDREVLDGAPPLIELHPSRWTDGASLCICDTVLTNETLAAAQEFIRSELFPEEQELWVYPRHRQRAFHECIKMDRDAAAAWLAGQIQADQRESAH
ncbi:hypothetical protein [Massilia sp. DD77]|uniref:hypothetical protein n=1 Tax=Massilia sp. DD77 TaxID=3109349 RepID=UPI003000D7D5